MSRKKNTGLKQSVTLKLGFLEEKGIFRQTFDQSPIGRSITSPDGELLKINKKFADMLGYAPEELSGFNFSEISIQEDIETSKECIRCLLAGEKENYSFIKQYRHKKGHIVIAEVHTSLIRDEEGTPVAFNTNVIDISDRKKQEEKISESERKFLLVFETAQYAITITEPATGNILDVNPCFNVLTGYDKKEVIGKSTIALKLWVNDKDRENVVNDLRKNIAVNNREYMFRIKSGKIINGLFSANVISLNGHPYIISCINDVTEQKLADQKIQQHFHDQKILSEVSEKLVTMSDLNEIYNYIGCRIFDLVSDSYVFLSRYLPEKKAVKIEHQFGMGKFVTAVGKLMGSDPFALEIKISDMTPEELALFKSREMVKMDGGLYSLSARKVNKSVCKATEKLLGISEVYTMGFSWEDKLYGGITILQSKRGFPEKTSLIEALINLAAVAIQRRYAEDQTIAHKLKYESLFDLGADAILLLENSSGKILEASKMAVEMYGYSMEEMIGMKCTELYSESGRENITMDESEVRKGRVIHVPLSWHRKKNETVFPVEIAVRVFEWKEKAVQLVAVRDITQRINAENTIRESEEKWKSLVSTTPDFISLLDNKARFLFLNKYAEGFSEKDVIGKSVLDFVMEESKALYLEKFETCMASQTTMKFEYSAFGENNSVRWYENYLVPVKGQNDKQNVMVVARDITERKNNEEILRKNEHFIQNILNTTPNLIYIYDIFEQRNIYANRELINFLGYTPEEVQTMGSELFNNILHPEDTERVALHHARFINAKEKDIFEVEYRMKHSNGQWRWLRSKDILYSRTSDGKRCQVLGSTEDFTDRRSAKEKLRESEEKYRLTVESIGEGIFTTEQGKFVYTNKAFSSIFGYTYEELAGKNSWDLAVPEERERVRNTILQKSRINDSSPTETRCLKSDNSEIYIEIRISGNDFNNLTYGLVNDITVRKEMEEQIEKNYGLQKVLTRLLTLSLKNISLDEILQKALPVIIGLPWLTLESKGAIFLTNRKTGMLEMKASNNLLDSVIRNCQNLEFGKCICGIAAATGQLQFRNCVADDHIISYQGMIPHGHYCVPIIYSSNVLGVINTYIKHDHCFNAQEASFLQAVADTLAGIIVRKKAEEDIVNLAKFPEENPNQVMRVSEKGELIYANSASREMLEHWKCGLSEMVPGDIKEFVNKGFALSRKIVVEYKCCNKLYNISVTPIPENHYVNLYFNDITSQKKAEQDVRKSEKLFRTTFEAAPIGVSLTSLDGKFVLVNQALCEMVGYSQEELEGKPVNEITHPSDQTATKDNLIRVLEKSSIHFEKRYIHKNGQIVWVSVNAATFTDENNKPLYHIAQFLNISERKLYEQELADAKDKAEESDRLKSAFLANMSHEIRTPLNGILGFSQLMDNENLAVEKRIEYVGIIKKCGNQLLSVIDDIVDISKIEAGIITFKDKENNLNAIMSELQIFFKSVMNDKNKKQVDLSLDCGLDDNHSNVIVDEMRFYQVMSNLLNNAIKFTDDGFIHFGYHVVNDELHFFVKDTGIGIPQDQLETVFDPFVQAYEFSGRNFGGTGLGLSISKKLVEFTGGKMWIDSARDSGTTVHFTLPFKRPVRSAEVIQETEVKPVSEAFKFATILIVDDDLVNLKFLQDVFENTGADIITAFNGQSAVELVRDNSNINMVLMDIRMPGMNGLDATREIRKFNPGIPVIAQTAYGMSDDWRKCADAGCSNYISKPIKISDLMQLMAKYLKTGRKGK